MSDNETSPMTGARIGGNESAPALNDNDAADASGDVSLLLTTLRGLADKLHNEAAEQKDEGSYEEGVSLERKEQDIRHLADEISRAAEQMRHSKQKKSLSCHISELKQAATTVLEELHESSEIVLIHEEKRVHEAIHHAVVDKHESPKPEKKKPAKKPEVKKSAPKVEAPKKLATTEKKHHKHRDIHGHTEGEEETPEPPHAVHRYVAVAGDAVRHVWHGAVERAADLWHSAIHLVRESSVAALGSRAIHAAAHPVETVHKAVAMAKNMLHSLTHLSWFGSEEVAPVAIPPAAPPILISTAALNDPAIAAARLAALPLQGITLQPHNPTQPLAPLPAPAHTPHRPQQHAA